MSMRKMVLWVEDFAQNSELATLDDPLGAVKRDEEILDVFPSYIAKHVHTIEDPTELPAHMKAHGTDYEFVILDVNFEASRISQDPEARKAFFTEMRNYLNVSESECFSEEGTKKLGYILYYYLLIAHRIPAENMAFFSAYANDDLVKINGQSRIDKTFGKIKPVVMGKDRAELEKFFSERFPNDRLSNIGAIIRAKNLFSIWKKEKPAGTVFSDVKATGNKKDPDYTSEVFSELCGIVSAVLDAPTPKNEKEAQASFHEILNRLTYPFEVKMNRNYSGVWEKGSFALFRLARNIYAHRYPSSALSSKEFLLLTALCLRTLFDPLDSPLPLLHDEEWLVSYFDNISDKNGVLEKLDDHGIRRITEETIRLWYVDMASKAGFLGDSVSMLYSYGLKDDYTLENILQLLCARAMGTEIDVQPVILNPQFYIKDGQTPASPPVLKCSFSISKAEYDSQSAVQQMAKAYIYSQIKEGVDPIPQFSIII